MEEAKEKTRIVITNGKENIGVFLNNPDATTKELLRMHCCLVNVLIRDMVARGMTVTKAIESIQCSDEEALKMYIEYG
ncbi:MAG: hypothetical protein K2H89_11195 [Oscillospiraceae bacterium]|nr:hypothetical protein [Oscillospiraceae bacterium]